MSSRRTLLGLSKTRIIAPLFALACLTAVQARPARAADDKVLAKAHYEAATRLYDVHEYAAALQEYKAGYLVRPDPSFLYNIGQCVEVARSTVPQTCDCTPGIVTVPVTNPAFLALGNNGANVVEVHTRAEISWAMVHYESPSGPGERYFIDSGSNGAAQYRRPNLCTNGSQQGAEVGITLTLAGGEQCDHGNMNGTPGDHCTANCLVQ
jgi:hypothetical protein